jgi:hypothetical protein
MERSRGHHPPNTFYCLARSPTWPHRAYEAVVALRTWTGEPTHSVCSVTQRLDGRWETALSWNGKTEAEGGLFSRWRCHEKWHDAVSALESLYGVRLDHETMQNN